MIHFNRRTITLAAMALGLASMGFAANADTLKDIQTRKKLLVAIDLSVPPFGMTDAAMQPQGSDVDVARALGEPLDGLSRLEAAHRAVTAVQELARDVGIPKGLGELGVREEHVRPVVEEAMKSGNVPVNPRRACAEDLARILRQSL